ncbi:9311_t:CDS:2 [Scutellospora calospora]|uniref:9311_t:CDS:1 n=1 Tax=Scutellospora calospora TaxID=85575 RepID=A0ACA9K6L8_9GLOM|nr:9311_t:CDS:2 [Scutellospora calospora]
MFTMMLYIFVACFMPLTYATDHTVVVGGPGNVLTYTPKNVTAQPVASATNPPTNYTITVNQTSTGAYYYMCSITGHCQGGMWGVIFVSGSAPSGTAAPSGASPTSTDGTGSGSTPSPTSTKSSGTKNVNINFIVIFSFTCVLAIFSGMLF